MTSERIRFGANIITFFESAYWGLPPKLKHPQWTVEFNKDPRRYFDGMLDGVRDAGLTGVELAPDPGGFEGTLIAYGSAAGFKEALEQRGLQLTSSYGAGRVYVGEAMEDSSLVARADDYIRRHAEFLVELGANTITFGNIPRAKFAYDLTEHQARAEDFLAPVPRETHERYAEHMNRLGDILRPYGVKMAIHTDAYSICCRNEDIATVLSLTDPDTVQLCPDAGHITLDGGDAVAVLREHIDRIPTMHWKDCIGHLGGHTLLGDPKERHDVMLTYFRILGSGTVDWREWMRILRDAEWSGWAIEEIDNSFDPIGELVQGLAFYRSELEPLLG